MLLEWRPHSYQSCRPIAHITARHFSNVPYTLLAAAQEALDAVASHSHAALCQAAREHTFVGHIGANSVLLQHNTKLLLVNLAPLSRDLAYQQALLLCGAWRPGAAAAPAERIALGDAPGVGELLDIGLEARGERGELEGDDEDPVRTPTCVWRSMLMPWLPACSAVGAHLSEQHLGARGVSL